MQFNEVVSRLDLSMPFGKVGKRSQELVLIYRIYIYMHQALPPPPPPLWCGGGVVWYVEYE